MQFNALLMQQYLKDSVDRKEERKIYISMDAYSSSLPEILEKV